MKGVLINMKRKLQVSFCSLFMMAMFIALPIFTAQADRPFAVMVNGHQVQFTDQDPIMAYNRLLVPVRGVFEHMGFYATWDSASRIARLERDDVIVFIPADVASFVVNGATITPDVPQQIVNNRLLLPLRA